MRAILSWSHSGLSLATGVQRCPLHEEGNQGMGWHYGRFTYTFSPTTSVHPA